MRSRHITTLGLSLVAVFVCSAVAAASVFAAEWLDNGASITTAVKVDTAGTLELEDMGAPGKPEVRAEGDNTGTVGPGAKDLIETITVLKISLIVAGSCTTLELVEAVNLPWETNLVNVNGTIRDEILPDGKGNPGWLVECNTLLGKVDDVCTNLATSATSTLMTNEAGGIVDAKFDAVSEEKPANCTVGGEKQGLVLNGGLISVLASEAGHSISVS